MILCLYFPIIICYLWKKNIIDLDICFDLKNMRNYRCLCRRIFLGGRSIIFIRYNFFLELRVFIFRKGRLFALFRRCLVRMNNLWLLIKLLGSMVEWVLTNKSRLIFEKCFSSLQEEISTWQLSSSKVV